MSSSKNEVLRALRHALMQAEHAASADDHGTWEAFSAALLALNQATQTLEAAEPEYFAFSPGEGAELRAVVVEIRHALDLLALKIDRHLGLPAPDPPS